MPCGHYFKPDGLLQWLSQVRGYLLSVCRATDTNGSYLPLLHFHTEPHLPCVSARGGARPASSWLGLGSGRRQVCSRRTICSRAVGRYSLNSCSAPVPAGVRWPHRAVWACHDWRGTQHPAQRRGRVYCAVMVQCSDKSAARCSESRDCECAPRASLLVACGHLCVLFSRTARWLEHKDWETQIPSRRAQSTHSQPCLIRNCRTIVAIRPPAAVFPTAQKHGFPIISATDQTCMDRSASEATGLATPVSGCVVALHDRLCAATAASIDSFGHRVNFRTPSAGKRWPPAPREHRGRRKGFPG